MIILSWIKLPTNHNKASDPRTFVTTICPTAPTAIEITPIIRLRGERKKTLPPYSPIRFGVKTAHVRPQKTDSTARHVLIFSTSRTRYFHFNASRNQFNNIKRKSNITVVPTLDGESEEVSDLNLLIF